MDVYESECMCLKGGVEKMGKMNQSLPKTYS